GKRAARTVPPQISNNARRGVGASSFFPGEGMIGQVDAGRPSLAEIETAEEELVAATPGPCCAVVSWDAPLWALRIARHLRRELEGRRPAWRIELPSVAALSSLASLDISSDQKRES